MATAVDTLLVSIDADVGPVRRKLRTFEGQMDSTSKRAGNMASKIKGAIGVAFGVAAIASIARAGAALVRFGGDIEEMQAKSSAVFGVFTSQVRSDLSEFGDAVGRSSFELEEMAASIQDTFVPMGFARGEAAKLSVQLTKLATDVASFNNAQDKDVMAAFQSALVGNHETVRRFGIVITESTLKQEAYASGIAKVGAELTNTQKVQARLNIIQKGTTDAQGDALRTSGSFQNQTKRLSAELDKLGVAVIRPLMDSFAGLVNVTARAVSGFREFLISAGIIERTYENRKAAVEELERAEEKLVEATNAGNLKSNNVAGRTARQNLERAKEAVRSAQMRIVAMDAVADAALDAEEAEKKRSEANALSAAQQKKYNDTLKNLNFENEKLKREQRGATEATQEYFKVIEKLPDLTDAQRAAIRAQIEENHQLKASIAEVTAEEKKQEEARKEREATQKALEEERKANQERAADVIEDYKNRLSDLQAEVDGVDAAEIRLQQALRGVKGATQEQKDEIIRLHRQYEQLKLKAEEVDPVLEKFKEGINKAGDAVAHSLADALVEGKMSLDSFKDMFKAFVKELIAEAIRTYIIKRILGSVFGFFGAASAAAPAGAAAGAAGSVAPAVFTGPSPFPPAPITVPARGGRSISARVPRRATGGPVLVGESGPELFVPTSAGSIKNLMDTRNIMGNASGVTVVNQSFNIETGVSDTVR
ncbi:MAG: hypothetical protein VW683_11865, partial [Betaproteobacteria bacterium]